MERACVRKLVFSSSATIYGLDAPVPYHEGLGRGVPSNPYGHSKAMIEQILEDTFYANPTWAIVSLRYFNPIGAHESGCIGEDPQGVPNNLMPFMAQVAVGRRDHLLVFGDDYPTIDGTCRRDYLHVMDLAEGHVASLNILDKPRCEPINLGSGMPVSVLEMIKSFEKAIKKPIPYKIIGRRDGDLAEFWADAKKAESILKWKVTRSLDLMMRDTWRWQSNNPQGYSN
jgi:UDP-glucose 4-epimerase